MYKVTTNYNRVMFTANELNMGINGSIPFEVGMKSMKAIGRFSPELEAMDKTSKLARKPFEQEVVKFEAEFNASRTEGSPKTKVTMSDLPLELQEMKAKIEDEIEATKKGDVVVDLSDDEHKALVSVVENALKAMYKEEVEKKDEKDKEKKQARPPISFIAVGEFLEDLENAEKSKSKE